MWKAMVVGRCLGHSEKGQSAEGGCSEFVEKGCTYDKCLRWGDLKKEDLGIIQLKLGEWGRGRRLNQGAQLGDPAVLLAQADEGPGWALVGEVNGQGRTQNEWTAQPGGRADRGSSRGFLNAGCHLLFRQPNTVLYVSPGSAFLGCQLDLFSPSWFSSISQSIRDQHGGITWELVRNADSEAPLQTQ